MDCYIPLRDNFLGLRIYPISLRELLHFNTVPFDVYEISANNSYSISIKQNSEIDHNLLIGLLQKRPITFFILKEDYARLIEMQNRTLNMSMRRSMTDKNTAKHTENIANLLSINLSYLYEDVTNDDLLQLQYMVVKNLVTFLTSRPEFIPGLFTSFKKQHFSYLLAQPFISTIILIGLLKYENIYTAREIEQIATTNYFKDIGISSFYLEKYINDQELLKDAHIINQHPLLSISFLENRLPLNQQQLLLIKNHHFYERTYTDDETSIFGSEVIFTVMADIMATYLGSKNKIESTLLYYSLDITRCIVSPTHPNEFKMAVHFFKNFFDKL